MHQAVVIYREERKHVKHMKNYTAEILEDNEVTFEIQDSGMLSEHTFIHLLRPHMLSC